MEEIKKAVKNGYPEDSGKAKEAIIQDMTNKYSEKVDALLVSKEKEIMSV
jgi:ribosome recycling factor